MPVHRAAHTLTVVALAAALAACGRDDRSEVPAEEAEEPFDAPGPESVEEVLDPLALEVRRACTSVGVYWSAEPAASLRALDSLVTLPGGGGLRDACVVEVVLDQDPRRDDRDDVRTPFTSAGWLDVHEFLSSGPAEQSRVYQNDPVRCRVVERWDAGPGSTNDTTGGPVPGFRQLTACWRRGPMG